MGIPIGARLLALGAAAVAAKQVMADSQYRSLNTLQGMNNLHAEDEYREAEHLTYNSAPGNDPFRRWANAIQNPTNMEFLTMPLIQINQFIHLIKDNIVPISLAGIGISFAFPRQVGGFFNALFKGLNSDPTKKGFGMLFTGLTKTIGFFGKSILSLFNPARLAGLFRSPTGGVAVLAAFGMGIYALSQLYNELTGYNREKLYKDGDKIGPWI